MSSAKTYLYVSPAVNMELSSDVATPTTQEQNLKVDRDYTYVFSEGHSGSQFPYSSASTINKPRTSFQFMLDNLKTPGIQVVVWSWRCFVNPKRLDWAYFDVQDYVRQIHEHQASILFIEENIDTSTTVGRLALMTTVANAQYAYDIQAEKLKKTSSSVGTSCSSSCCTSKSIAASTGC